MRSKGRNLRIKAPMCRALKKLCDPDGEYEPAETQHTRYRTSTENLTDGEIGGFTGAGLFYKNHGIKWAGGVSMVTLGAK